MERSSHKICILAKHENLYFLKTRLEWLPVTRFNHVFESIVQRTVHGFEVSLPVGVTDVQITSKLHEVVRAWAA